MIGAEEDQALLYKQNGIQDFIQAVKDIVEGYNNTEHRMLKKSPNEK